MADAPPVVAQSADGVLHQFPAGTDMSVVDGVMKQYAAERAPKEEPKPEEPNIPGAVANKLGQVAVEAPAATIGGLATATKTTAQVPAFSAKLQLDLMHKVDEGDTDVEKLMKGLPDEIARAQLGSYLQADPAERAKMKQEAINTMAAPPGAVEHGAEAVAKSSEKLTAIGKTTFPVTPEEEQNPAVAFTGIVGSLAKYIGAGAAGGMPALIGVAGVDAFGEAYNKAKTAGATDQVAAGSAMLEGMANGGLMTVPIGQALKVFDTIPMVLKGKMIGALAEAAKSGTTLTAFSQISTLADNVIAQNTYDPGRKTLEGLGNPTEMAETFAAGAVLPLVGAGANRLFRGRDAVPNPKAVLDAPNLNDAIAKADQVAEGAPVDVDAIARQAQGPAEQQQAQMLKLFGGMNEGEVRPTEDGGYAYHVGDKEVPLEVWDEKAAAPEGDETPTVSPNLANTVRETYGKMGIDVVFIKDPDGKVPFDGAVDPNQPNTIFLSNNPQRIAPMVAGHEVGHLLENTLVPGTTTRAADVLHDLIQRGLTAEGMKQATGIFGTKEAGAPQRAAFPEGPEGAALHADAFERHVINEIGADLHGEAPMFPTYINKVVNEVQARYGDQAAKGLVQKLAQGIRETLERLRQFFFTPAELAQHGPPDAPASRVVTNLDEIHDHLAKMDAERFGTQAEKTNAALRDMKDKAQRDRLLKAPETPPGGAAEAAGPQGAEKAPEGQPPPGTAPAAPAATPEGLATDYESGRQKAATYQRWLREMDAARRAPAVVEPQMAALRQDERAIVARVGGDENRLPGPAKGRLDAIRAQMADLANPQGDTPAMAKIRAAQAAEHARMTNAAIGTQDAARFSPKAKEEEARGEPAVEAKPSQAEEAKSKEEEGGTKFSPKTDEPFFSSLKRGVEALRIEKAPPGQWEATIKNMPGVKAEERAWVGIEDWLRRQTKPVTKADVLGYIDEHEVKVGEVAKGVRQKLTPEEKTEMVNLGLSGKLNAKQKARYDELNRKELGSATKFGSYVLPGGKNYKELLLTLPREMGPKRREAEELAQRIRSGEFNRLDDPGRRELFARRDKLLDEARAEGEAETPAFSAGHWDEDNVLAHIRMDDRTGPNGEKVLHVAEIQSDWHQQGRKKGYREENEAQLAALVKEREELKAEHARAPNAEAAADLTDRLNVIHDKIYDLGRGDVGVPNAPFKTSWPELAMKRIMRYAAENGYDRVSWDTGQTNADRYDLSKHISDVTVHGEGDNLRVSATDLNDHKVIDMKHTTREGLADIIGKEAAEKLLAQPEPDVNKNPSAARRLHGLDLKVGGEGMRAFYDKQLPVVANKIGKRFGAKVEESRLATSEDNPAEYGVEKLDDGSGQWRAHEMGSEYLGPHFPTQKAAQAWLDGMIAEGAKNVATHSIPVTSAMREGVMRGQPLFSPRITDESRRKDKAYEDARPVYAALGRAPETQTIAQRWEKFKDQLGKRMLIATVDKYLQTKSIDPMAYMAQRNFNSSSGALEVLLTKGTLKLNGSAFDFAQRNGGVETQVIRPLHGEHGDWAWWVAANRAERLSAEDREHLFTPEQIETLKKTNRGELDFDYELPNGKTTRSREAAFMDTLRKYDEFNKNVMGLGVKAGLFKQETVDKLWANPFYVPFFRVAEKEGAAPFTGGQKTGGFAKQYGFKTLTGGTGKLHNDLWQNVIGNWGHLIDAAGKNIGANQVLDAAERTGVAGKVTQQQYDHQMTKADRDNTTWTMVDGKKQYWHVSDPLLFDAVSAIHSANFTDPFSKAANFFSRTLRMGVTSDPGFMLRVTIKDSEQAVATAPMSYNVLGNIVKGYRMTDLPGALRNVARAAAGMHEEALRESDELISVMAGGGLMRLGAGHAEGFRRTTAEAMSGEDLTWADGFRYIKRGARQVKEVLAQSEDINRAALYSELIKRGVPHDEATFAARDLEDFTLSGAAPWVRWIAHAVTFLNAGAQGLYKVGRSAADADRNVTAAVGGKVAWAASRRVATVMTATVLATLALDYIYRNNEDYKKRAEYDRNGKWWFHIGKYQFQIPMGFELAGLSRIATNALDMFFDKEMTGRRWANNALSIVGQNMFMNPTPQVIAPLLDVRTNTTGTGQPIEPKGMENLRPEEKFSSQNTLAARGLSTVGNKIARGIGGPTAEFSSPMQLDYLWNGYTGWLGSAILGSADRVARQFTHEPARPAADLWNVATRGVVSQGPTPQSRYIDTMYQQAEAADKAYGTYEDLIKRQQFQKAQDFYKENADLINRRGLVDAVVRSEGSLNQQIRMIQNNPNPQVTGEQKRLMIQQLQAIRNKTAESVFGAH